MAKRYGHYHSLASFIGGCIPRKGSGEHSSLFVHRVIEGLKRLDQVQQSNRAVTLPFDVDGIHIVHNGVILCKIFPRQAWIMVAFDGGGVAEVFDGAVERGLATDITGPSYRAWRVPAEGLDVIWEFAEGLSQPSHDEADGTVKHPRAFPGTARQLALEAFLQSGSMCPGFRRKKHKVNFTAGERIEFDHILPYAHGGASSDWNIQVLCRECNSLKRANAG